MLVLPVPFLNFIIWQELALLSDTKYSIIIKLFLPKEANHKDSLFQGFGCALIVMDARAT